MGEEDLVVGRGEKKVLEVMLSFLIDIQQTERKILCVCLQD